MTTKIETFSQNFLKKPLPDLKSGDTVRVYQRIKEGNEEKTQTFEGVIIAKKHGKEMGVTITVRNVVLGVGVERIFPLHSNFIEKIEILKRGRVRRAKLYYLRKAKGKRAKLKKEGFKEVIVEEVPKKDIKTDAKNEETKEEMKEKK